MSLLMIFVDGIGIGEEDPEKNPFARYSTAFFPIFGEFLNPVLPHDGIGITTDPSMGIPGLPQSATGQTALFTGVNAAKALGHHLSGFPGPTLRKILLSESIFLKLERRGLTGTFANAFTPEYFQRPDRTISASTWSVKASKFPFRMLDDDLVNDRAISHDLTNQFLRERGYDAPVCAPDKAAAILAEITVSVDFCLFEFILTDILGHKGNLEQAGEVVDRLDTLLHVVLDSLDLKDNTVLLTSDHGNFEDLSVKSHTYNSVPTMIWGQHREQLGSAIKCIEDIPHAILQVYR